MARHEHLPIYKAALDMTVHFEKLVLLPLPSPSLSPSSAALN